MDTYGHIKTHIDTDLDTYGYIMAHIDTHKDTLSHTKTLKKHT